MIHKKFNLIILSLTFCFVNFSCKQNKNERTKKIDQLEVTLSEPVELERITEIFNTRIHPKTYPNYDFRTIEIQNNYKSSLYANSMKSGEIYLDSLIVHYRDKDKEKENREFMTKAIAEPYGKYQNQIALDTIESGKSKIYWFSYKKFDQEIKTKFYWKVSTEKDKKIQIEITRPEKKA